MCGIIGYLGDRRANQILYDGLVILQHRGQDAAGIMTADKNHSCLHKGNGLVRDVFSITDMHHLHGNMGIGHVRYPTSGGYLETESQPFFVNYFSGIGLAHNGNLTNATQLRTYIKQHTVFEIKTNSDSELILLIFLESLLKDKNKQITQQKILQAAKHTQQQCKGAYAVVILLVGYGVLCFKDVNGIRPLVYGQKKSGNDQEYMVASESIALEMQGFKIINDVAAGEIIFFEHNRKITKTKCSGANFLTPCIFEYVYLSRPDSIIGKVSVFKARKQMGLFLAKKIKRIWHELDIDVVVPIPDTSRIAALAAANYLQVPYSEAMVKNRYIGRTFIMPGQENRKKSVRQKLNTIKSELKDKNVLLVDDSIVRGTTSTEIINLVREAGAQKVYFASACPPIRYPNVYGIDMATKESLIARHYDEEKIAQIIGANKLIFLDLVDLIRAVQQFNPELENFETSIFTGHYITQDINADYLRGLSKTRVFS